MANKPHGRQCINVSPGKTSHLLLKKKGPPFPDVYDPANPKLGTILYVAVTDLDNTFGFKATIVPQTDKKRLALQLVSDLGAGGGDPLDGLLGVTLFIVNAIIPLNPPATYAEPVSDVPVDYISDPAAP